MPPSPTSDAQRDGPVPAERAAGPSDAQAERMARNAGQASDFLRSLGHEQRLMILCHLSTGDKAVGELESLLGARQAAVSQQLARLRHEGLVAARREGKSVVYALADDRSRRLIGLLHEMFCERD